MCYKNNILNKGWPKPQLNYGFILYIYEKGAVFSSQPTKKDDIYFSLSPAPPFVTSPLPGLYKYPSFVFSQLCHSFSSRSSSASSFYSGSPAQWVKGQWWEAALLARRCHVNQIRRPDRKWHDLLQRPAKCRPGRHRYTDIHLLWVKGHGAPSVKQTHIYYSGTDVAFSPHAAFIRLVTDSLWFTENCTFVCWFFPPEQKQTNKSSTRKPNSTGRD